MFLERNYGAARVAQGAAWALVGGADSLCRLTYSGFHALKLLSTEPCRPFDRNRRGCGASILGRVDGWGCSADAHHMTAPHPEGQGALQAMSAALADAGIETTDVDYINAHGTATPANDKAEGLALTTLFKSPGPFVSSTKGSTGHTLGAAGAMEAVFCVLALGVGFAPSTVGLIEPDPAIRIRHVPTGGAQLPLRVALSNSFGFGGNNATLVFTRAES
jgi:3-oxoacyl-[acyl-carrier-protein] synthase-1